MLSTRKGGTGSGRAAVEFDKVRGKVFLRKIALQTATFPRKASLLTCVWREATPSNLVSEDARTNRTVRFGGTVHQAAKTASKRFLVHCR